MRRARARGRRLRVDYFERFKARMAAVGQVYSQSEAKPNRPLQVGAERVELANQIVDQIIGCKRKGVDFHATVAVAEQWGEYEWGMVEPALAAKRAAA